MYYYRITEADMCQTLAGNLRYLRKSRSKQISQKALARILNLPTKTILNYESGHTSPSAYAVFMLAGYFECTVEELLTKHLYERTNNP